MTYFNHSRKSTPDPQITALVFGPCSIHVHLGFFEPFPLAASEMRARSNSYQIVILCRVFPITGIMYSSMRHAPAPSICCAERLSRFCLGHGNSLATCEWPGQPANQPGNPMKIQSENESPHSQPRRKKINEIKKIRRSLLEI